MLFQNQNIPEFGRARSKHILLGLSTVEHNFVRSSAVKTYIEHSRNISCLGQARSSLFVSDEHGLNLPNFGRTRSKHTKFQSRHSKHTDFERGRDNTDKYFQVLASVS